MATSGIPTDRHITYQCQMRKCGKPSCHRCKEGEGHGPYWYAYWRNDQRRLRSGYIGKVLPAHIQTGTRGKEEGPGRLEGKGASRDEPIPA